LFGVCAAFGRRRTTAADTLSLSHSFLPQPIAQPWPFRF
jgi:hypothetical protein